MENMKKLIIIFLVSCILVGCATTPEKAARRQLDFINYSQSNFPPQSKDYPIDLFFEGKPQRNYEVIGQITGFVVHDYNLRPMLEEKIRQVGGDGVIDIEVGTGHQTSSSSGHKLNIFTGKFDTVTHVYSDKVINIKGKVIKYKEQPDKGIVIQKEIFKDIASEKKKTSIYSFEEIKEWYNKVKDREWRKISESEDTTHCYDTRNITYPSKGIVRVYTITYYESKKAINDKINHYRQLGLSTKGYENLYGTLTLQEINCNNKTYLPIYFMDYDKNRNPLNQSYDLSSNGWSEISSTMPTLKKLYKAVCPGGK